eukprot:Nitzschia sp. Nitz4//scaffold16_size188269//181694//182764//NITZ4_001820-RA/size188269-processed-gene-0.31-mRNA-1//1//CDS//3329538604//7150//frame0
MTLLPIVSLGTQGLKVTRLGYGCMGLTTGYGTKLPDAEISSLLEKVYGNGVSFWDTANVYCYFDPKLNAPVCQEEKIAPSIHKLGRENIVIASKSGIKARGSPTPAFVANSDPAFLREQCEASLKRLKVDCIDLFYIHRIDQNIPIERSMVEMRKLVEEGKVKYIGLSECSANTIRRAHQVHPITCIQMEYSLWCRGIEEEVLPTCKELGIGLVAYAPLGRGFFGGAHKLSLSSGDWRNGQERFQQDENHKMYARVEELAQQKGVTPAQLALAWVQAQQHRAAGVVPIPGTTKEKNLLSNVASASISLTNEEVETLEAAVPKAEGSRYHQSNGMTTWEDDKNPSLTPEEAKALGLA